MAVTWVCFLSIFQKIMLEWFGAGCVGIHVENEAQVDVPAGGMMDRGRLVDGPKGPEG